MATAPLNRQQLAQFLPSHEAIKAFERLFAETQTALPAGIEQVQQSADSALAQASAALAGVSNALVELQGALLAVSASQPFVDVYTPPIVPPALGTMSLQNSNAVAITGGSVAATTLSASGLISANGGQIAFPVTAIPSASVNVLDDYREGSFVPVVQGVTTPGVGTYSFQLGKYTKIGNLVEFSLHVTWTSHTGTGNTKITGLPFTSNATGFLISPFVVFQSGGPIPGANKVRSAVLLNNSTTIVFYEMDQTTGATTSVNAITPSGTFHISGKYFVA